MHAGKIGYDVDDKAEGMSVLFAPNIIEIADSGNLTGVSCGSDVRSRFGRINRDNGGHFLNRLNHHKIKKFFGSDDSKTTWFISTIRQWAEAPLNGMNSARHTRALLCTLSRAKILSPKDTDTTSSEW